MEDKFTFLCPIDNKTILRIAETLSTYKYLSSSYPTQPTKVFHTEHNDKDNTEIYYSKPQNLKGVRHYCGKEVLCMRTYLKQKKDQGDKKSQSEVHKVENDFSDEGIPKKA